MASTSFTDGVTLTAASWFNDINDGIYKGVGTTGYSTVASATTPDIFATTVSGVINYTGTTTCTGFTAAPSAGARRVLVCAGAAVFTAGTNMLIDGVTSGNNLTCAANDLVYVYAVSTTQFRLTRVPYAGTSGGLVKIGTQTAAAAAQVDFTSAGYPTAFDGTYNEILFTFTDVQPSSAGSNLWIRYSNDGGSTFKAGATDYKYAGFYLGDVGGTLTIASASAGQIVLATAVNSPITEAVDGELRLFNPASTTNKKRVLWHTGYADNVTDNTRTHHGEGHMSLNTSAVTAIRFMFSSGNISGTIACYGVQK